LGSNSRFRRHLDAGGGEFLALMADSQLGIELPALSSAIRIVGSADMLTVDEDLRTV